MWMNDLVNVGRELTQYRHGKMGQWLKARTTRSLKICLVPRQTLTDLDEDIVLAITTSSVKVDGTIDISRTMRRSAIQLVTKTLKKWTWRKGRAVARSLLVPLDICLQMSDWSTLITGRRTGLLEQLKTRKECSTDPITGVTLGRYSEEQCRIWASCPDAQRSG